MLLAPEERADLALTFVIDVSGSMRDENRLTLVKHSLTLLVEELRPTDSVGIFPIAPLRKRSYLHTLASQKNRILDAIFALQPERKFYECSAWSAVRLYDGLEPLSATFRQSGDSRFGWCGEC